MGASGEFLIQDPYHEYGSEFIEHIYRKYGHRAICFYSDRKERSLSRTRSQQLRHPYVAASYNVNLEHLDQFVGVLRSRHRVNGVVPFNETSVVPASYLSSSLRLGWVKPAIISRFRDKFALKEYLRRHHPAIRINASRRIGTVAEVLQQRSEAPYQRFVLKPNDGFGNRDIGVFDRSTAPIEVERYLARLWGRPIVMEEYIEGSEFFVNGQIDDRGNILTFAIFQYIRGAANGRHNLDIETIRLPHGTPLFTTLTEYAENVLRATGLTRSPFHLEVKVDEMGPSLIEVAARFAGHGNALVSGSLHGPQLNVIDLASRYYLNCGEREAPPLDWATYNSHAVRYVHGVASEGVRIYDLAGISQVESLPEFSHWVKKPVIGTRLERTVDCLSMPWSLVLKAGSEASAEAAAREVRRLIRWNCASGRVARTAMNVKLLIGRAPAKIRRNLRWMLAPLTDAAAAVVHASRRS